MRKSVEIASDMGESFGNYVLGQPEEVMKHINCAYVACGWHAGDPSVMHQTVRWAKQYNVVLGAHPGYPDLMGFGRRYMRISPEEARDYVIYQVGALKNFAEHVGIKLRTAKPHGAFYVWATEREENAKAVVDGLLTIGSQLEAVHLPSLPFGPLHQAVKKAGLHLVREIYPGLSYAADGGFAVTRKYEATAEAESRLIEKWLKTGKINAVDGREIEIDAETICIHGDMDNAVEILFAITKTIAAAGVEISSVLK